MNCRDKKEGQSRLGLLVDVGGVQTDDTKARWLTKKQRHRFANKGTQV